MSIRKDIVTRMNLDVNPLQMEIQNKFRNMFQNMARKNWRLAALFVSSLAVLVVAELVPGAEILTLVALVPIFLAAEKIAPKWLTLWSFLVGFVYLYVVAYPLSTLNTWWWQDSSGFFWQNKELFFLGAVGFIAATTATTTFALAIFIYSKWLRQWFKRAPILSALFLPIIWIAFEWVRVWAYEGLEWTILGHPLGNNLFFARTAHVAGMYTLSFIIVAVNFCLFLILKSFIPPKADTDKKTDADKKTTVKTIETIKNFLKNNKLPIIFILIIFAVLIFNNHMVVKENQNINKNQLRISIVSPDIKTTDITQEEGINHILSLLMESALTTPDLVVMPENIFPLLVIDEKTGRPINYESDTRIKKSFDQIINVSKVRPKTSLIIGFHTMKDGGHFNSALVLENGVIVDTYHKQKILPFTERNSFLIESIAPLTRGESGEDTAVLKTQHGKFGIMMCSEILTFEPRADVRAFINLSNDNIFGSPRVATYNQTIIKLRAIQLKKPIIRSTKGQFSGIFDQTGLETPLLINTINTTINTQSNPRTNQNPEILSGLINIP